ncbi:MAG: hypothetical protein ACLFWD_11410 [Anaerolineales bacterium]
MTISTSYETRARVSPGKPTPSLALAVCLLAGLFIAGCIAETPAPTATATNPPPSPTPTFEFPTLAPTATEGRDAPTPDAPEPLAGAGDVLYQSEFDTAGDWPLGRDSLGAVSLSNGGLSVVMPRPGLQRLVESPAPSANNFILDVEFRAEICQGEDEFGVAFWLTPEGNHMRFTITCQGGVRLRRVLGGERQAWVPFMERVPAVLPGAPAENRLTVRAQGNRFQLYVNGFHILSGTETALPPGGSGLAVASSANQGQTTVIFDSFILYHLDPAATPTPGKTETPDG